MTYISSSPDETIAYAKKFATKIKPGQVIALSGDLGSGKTTFIKGLALGLGLKNEDDVKSPTFALMHIYHAKLPIYHFDLYRLDAMKDLRAIGLDEFLEDRKAVACVEWANKFPEVFGKETIFLKFEVVDAEKRKISEGEGK